MATRIRMVLTIHSSGFKDRRVSAILGRLERIAINNGRGADLLTDKYKHMKRLPCVHFLMSLMPAYVELKIYREPKHTRAKSSRFFATYIRDNIRDPRKKKGMYSKKLLDIAAGLLDDPGPIPAVPPGQPPMVAFYNVVQQVQGGVMGQVGAMAAGIEAPEIE